MKLRFAGTEDVSRLIRARFDYFEAEHFVLTDERKAEIGAQLRDYYPKHLNRDCFAAVIEGEGGEFVSVAMLIVSEKPASISFPTGKTGLILNVLTYPEHRRKGFASQTLGLLIDEAKRQRLSYIELSASEMGKPLYEKLGFKVPEPSRFTEMRLII